MADSDSPPKPEAGTTVRASDEKATCMRWYHKPSSEPESKETRTHACKQNINKNLFLFFTSSFLACSHTVIIFYHGQSACRHCSSAFHLRRIREPVYAKRTLLERTTSHAHSTLFCRLLFEIQLESFASVVAVVFKQILQVSTGSAAARNIRAARNVER